jgi:hypothetical protein
MPRLIEPMMASLRRGWDRDLVFPYQVSKSTWISRGEMLAILGWKNAGRRTSVEARMSSFSLAAADSSRRNVGYRTYGVRHG